MVTALSDMAAAGRPPQIGDARVPCPLCGGLIHPVAGRCKHCKEDLSSFRAGRPQAAAVLPALNGKTTVAAPAGNGTSVHAAATAVPLAIPAHDGSAPILPQRTTGRSMAAQRPRGNLLRNWPLLVIILAVIAIVSAVVIMVLPADQRQGGKRQLMPAPAPDRMETMPDNSKPDRRSQSDPWAAPGDPDPDSHANVTPDPPRPPTVDPDDDTDDDVVDPDDLYNGLGGGGVIGGMTGGNGAMAHAFYLNLVDAACKKLKSCPNAASRTTTQMCNGFSSLPKPPLSSCVSGQRCVEAIDQLDCDVTSATARDPMNIILSLQDCARAITEC